MSNIGYSPSMRTNALPRMSPTSSTSLSTKYTERVLEGQWYLSNEFASYERHLTTKLGAAAAEFDINRNQN